ncbi:MAG: hypothetical protein AB1505_13005 [Candidatus Latescibacterota bacterium]
MADPCLALFSRSGFTRRSRDLAAAHDDSRLVLVDLEELHGV